MEKEQIVKALECCANYKKFGDCNNCPAREECANEPNFIEKEALSIIREQEERIEELMLEYAGFEAGAKAAARFILAATAHKMHEAIKDRCIKGGVYPAFVARTIENVANELIDNALPANLVSLEDVSKVIKDYCCELIDQGKDAVEVTEFNADIQKRSSAEIFGKAEHDEKT